MQYHTNKYAYQNYGVALFFFIWLLFAIFSCKGKDGGDKKEDNYKSIIFGDSTITEGGGTHILIQKDSIYIPSNILSGDIYDTTYSEREWKKFKGYKNPVVIMKPDTSKPKKRRSIF